MAIIPTYLFRTTAILRLPQAIARGVTAEGWIRELKAAGLSYRRTNMLADFRSMLGIERKKDAAKYTRKDRLPSMHAIADVEWDLSAEYMYKMRVWVRTAPDEPLHERFVNVMSDRLLRPSEAEAEVFKRWGTWEKYAGETPERAEVSEIRHKIPKQPSFEFEEEE